MPSGLSLPAGPGVPSTLLGAAAVLLAMLVERGGVELGSAFTVLEKLERLISVCGWYWVIIYVARILNCSASPDPEAAFGLIKTRLEENNINNCHYPDNTGLGFTMLEHKTKVSKANKLNLR